MEAWIVARVKEENGHWLWQRQLHKKGYAKGKVGNPQKSVWVHRLSYETFVRPIPDGLTIDHLCLVKSCVNPDHLEAVSSEENTRRFQEKWQKENPNFKCGHPRTGENRKYKGTKVRGVINPRRVKLYGCRICNDVYMKEYLPKWRKKNATSNSLR